MATASPDTHQASDMESLYQRRLHRYVTAMRNGKPDMIPIRPFVAEFTGVYAGYTCQELAHDYELAFAAARKCAADFDWDAVVPNMVYVWTGLAQALGLKYYGIPGIHIPADTGFQYREPPEQKAFMRADEYDQLIEDPTGYLLNVWLPRVSEHVQPMGAVDAGEQPGPDQGLDGDAQVFHRVWRPDLAPQRVRTPRPSRNLQAPMDIIADKLRGYGAGGRSVRARDKVVAACEALMPHLYHVAKTTADPHRFCPSATGCMRRRAVRVLRNIQKRVLGDRQADHRGAVGRRPPDAVLRRRQMGPPPESFAELPQQSIVYHVDQGDVSGAHQVLGEKFCISGGIPNVLLATARRPTSGNTARR